MFSGGVYLRSSAESSMQSTFSEPHNASVTQQELVRLKDIDIANPVFVLR
jgi:hypothetical protein